MDRNNNEESDFDVRVWRSESDPSSEVYGARCYSCNARFHFPNVQSYVKFHEWALSRKQCPSCKKQCVWIPIHVEGEEIG